MRCGATGVPALATEPHGQRVGGAGERPLAQPEAAHVEAGVAVQAEDVVHAVEGAGLDQVQRSPGHDLLGGLEEQPHAPGQQAAGVHLGQGECRPDQPGGVHVVATGVGDAGNRCSSTGR